MDMKKILTILVAVAVVVVGVWLVLVKPAQTPSAVVPSNTVINGQLAITMKNFAFSPAQVTIARGTEVTWTNGDSAPHQPVSDSGSPISAPRIPNGGTYSVVFEQAGTYSYHCAIHPSMTGTIIVQ
jgi:plastocyanin